MKRGIILLCGLIFILSSCNNEEITIEQSVKESDLQQALRGKPDKITICHYEAVTDTWKQMEIHPNALENHLAHGDIYGEFCPDYRLDEDNDGVTNDLEACPDTPAGEPVDAAGCAESQKDDDGDGVTNDLDLCPGTPSGDEVDEDGCATSLYTNIPDPNFEQALIDQGIDSVGLLDGRVLTTDVSGVTSLNVINKNISDLTGIEAFVNLTDLLCYNNLLTYLDLSNNLLLEYLFCHANQLTSINLTNITTLKGINCKFNNLATLDVSNNLSLTFLACYNNQIVKLDLSKNYNLYQFKCNDNALTELKLNNGNNINFDNNLPRNGVIDYPDFRNNPNLTCIEVDDATYSDNNWSDVIDPQTSFSEDCGY